MATNVTAIGQSNLSLTKLIQLSQGPAVIGSRAGARFYLTQLAELQESK